MQQRIIVKVPMKKEKDRSKAMKVAVEIIGVSSVEIGGEDRDRVIVIGNGVDAVNLTKSLIKKFDGATLVRVEPLLNYSHRFHQDQASYMTYEFEAPPNNYSNNYTQPMCYYNNPPPPYYYYPYNYDRPVYDSNCSIM